MDVRLIWIVVLTALVFARGFTLELSEQQSWHVGPPRRALSAGHPHESEADAAIKPLSDGDPMPGRTMAGSGRGPREIGGEAAGQRPGVPARGRRSADSVYAEDLGDELLIHGHKVMTEHKTRERRAKETARNTVMIICFSVMGFCIICTAFTVKKLCSYE